MKQTAQRLLYPKSRGDNANKHAVLRSLLHKQSPMIRVNGDFRPDVAVATSTLRGVRYSSSTYQMYRINFNDLYNPLYQYNPSSTTYSFSTNYDLTNGPTSTQIAKYKVVALHADFRETCSPLY